MLPIVAGIVSALIQNKLPGIADAVINKGLDYVEDKLDDSTADEALFLFSPRICLIK